MCDADPTASQTALDAPMAEEIGKQLGMFREEGQRGQTLEEMVLEADRLRRDRLAAASTVEVTAVPAPATGDPL